MKGVNNKDLINVIDKSAEELHQRIDMQRHLMVDVIEQEVGGGTFN